MLGVLDRAPGGAGEAGPGPIEPVHDQEGLRHAPAGQLGCRGLEQSREDTVAARGGVDHPADLDLVRAEAVKAEETDQAVGLCPQEVVDLPGGSRLEGPPLELEAATVHCNAGGGELFDSAEIARPEPWFGAEPAGRSLRSAHVSDRSRAALPSR